MPNAVVLGDWHLASVTAAALVELEHRVRVWAGDTDTTLALLRGERAAAEPGVARALDPAADGCEPVRGQEDLAVAVGSANLAVVAFDSATAVDGTMTDERPAEAVRLVWQLSGGRCPVVVSSQVRAGTCDALLEELAGTRDDPRLVYLPENLRLGTALADFLSPARLVVGCNGPPPPAVTELTGRIHVEEPIHLRLVEAELVKHGTNAFLAMCIAFANDLGWIARGLGASAAPVLAAVQADPRIGSQAPLRPGDAYSGATLERDVCALRGRGETVGRDGLFAAISRSNTVHGMAAVGILDRVLDGLDGRKVCLLGLTYKPNVSTLRDSPALRLAPMLVAHGARVTAFDPVAETLMPPSPFERFATMREATAGADCVILMTPHDAIELCVLASCQPARLMLLDATNAGRGVHVPPAWTLLDLWTT